MELIKKSWRDVTINEYFYLIEKMEDDKMTLYDKAVEKVSFVTGLSTDDIWALPINEFNNTIDKTSWLEKFNIDTSNRNYLTKLKINNKEYSVNYDLTKFNVAQYVDFQTLYSKRKKDYKVLPQILSCFIIPKGKEYNNEYDISKVQADILNYLDIMTAEEILFFFLVSYLNSIRTTNTCFKLMMKRIMKIMKKNKEAMEKLKELEAQWDKTMKNTLDGFLLSIQ